MTNTLRLFGFACLAAVLVVSPLAAQSRHRYYDGPPYRPGTPMYAGGCYGNSAAWPAEAVRIRTWSPITDEQYRWRDLPSTAARSPSVRTHSAQYYTPQDDQVLYHPVVVPLNEFLQPGEPVALSPDEVARSRAAAEARNATPLPPQGTAPAATTTEADPFEDDAVKTDASAAPSPTTPPTAEAAEPEAETTFAEEEGPAEEPAQAEAEPTSEAEGMPEAEVTDADDDPFNEL